jgi:hypothetical protein
MELIPPLRARSWVEKRRDYKWILSACNNTDIWRFNKAANPYLEDSTTCAFRLRTTRRPCGTEGRASVNSTASPGELSLLAPPFGFLLRQGAPVLHGLTAAQSLGYPSPLCFGSDAGEKVVRPRDVRLWRVAAVQLCVPLQKVFS